MHLLLFLSSDWLIFCGVHDSSSSHSFIYLFILFLSDEAPMIETLDFTIRKDSDSSTYLIMMVG